MSSDHFASHLDEMPASAAHAGSPSDEMPPESSNGDAADETSPHAAVKQKRTVPKWCWIMGIIALFVIGGVGYKKWFGAHHKPEQPAENGPTAHFNQTNPQPAAHLSDDNGGMGASDTQQATRTASEPAYEETQPSGRAVEGAEIALGRDAAGATTTQASAVSARAPISEDVKASMQAALDAKEQEIAQLKKALADARRFAARATRVVKRTRRTRAHATSRPPSEVLLGFHIKQIIPGQGWVEDEETGKQTIVVVGDTISGVKVTKIDAERYEIQTTAGVIRF